LTSVVHSFTESAFSTAHQLLYCSSKPFNPTTPFHTQNLSRCVSPFLLLLSWSLPSLPTRRAPLISLRSSPLLIVPQPSQIARHAPLLLAQPATQSSPLPQLCTTTALLLQLPRLLPPPMSPHLLLPAQLVNCRALPFCSPPLPSPPVSQLSSTAPSLSPQAHQAHLQDQLRAPPESFPFPTM